MDVLERYRGCERPERLTHLDQRVDPITHLGASRVGEDAAMAERAGTELHPPAVPGYDVAIGDQLCGSFGASPGRAVLRDRDPIREGAKRGLHLAGPMRGAVE